MHFQIIGGYLEMDKKTFARAMLAKDSVLKKIMNYNTVDSSSHTKVIKDTERNIVKIDYNNSANVKMDENYEKLIYAVKDRYKEKIIGRVVIEYVDLFSAVYAYEFREDGIKMERSHEMQ